MRDRGMIGAYLRSMLPAVLAFAFSGVYAIVDGFFVGRYIGDSGLAGINIAYPMTALLQAVGTGVGMGGSIHMSISLGRGERESHQRLLGTTLVMLLGMSVLLTVGLWFAHPTLLRLFGATGAVYDRGQEYIQVIILGTFFQVFSTGLAPVFRNLGRSLFAMAAMMAGFVTNIVLDATMIGVLGWGMYGAALATIIGQGVTAVLCLGMLVKVERGVPLRALRPALWAVRRILTTGVSPFGLTMSPNLVIMFVNLGAVRYGGELAVAAYAVVSYVAVVIQLILQGVGDGSQPTMSRFFGEGREADVRLICKLAYCIALGASAAFALITVLGQTWFPTIFGASADAIGLAARVLCLIVAGYPGIAVIRVTISYFYSIGFDRYAYVLVYGEPLLMVVLLLALPLLGLGLDGVWLAIPCEQLLMACAALLLRRMAHRSAARRAKA